MYTGSDFSCNLKLERSLYYKFQEKLPRAKQYLYHVYVLLIQK